MYTLYTNCMEVISIMSTLEIQHFCRNVRALRIRHGLSLGEMARILELSEEQLTLLESGTLTDEMDIRILEHIYLDFGIRPDALFSKQF